MQSVPVPRPSQKIRNRDQTKIFGYTSMAREITYRICYAFKHVFQWVQKCKTSEFPLKFEGQDAKRWEPSKGEPKNCVGILHENR